MKDMHMLNYKELDKLLTIESILEYTLNTIVVLWMLSFAAICVMNSWIPAIIFGILWITMYLVNKKYKYIEDKIYEYKVIIINNNVNGTTCSKVGD